MSQDDPLSAQHWLQVAVDATRETGETSLGCESISQIDGAGAKPTSAEGAYVPLVASKERFLLGMLASETTCQSLARRLLGMEDDEEEPTQEDVADAVGEIVNIVAGVMQRQLADAVGAVELGLPFYVRGKVATTDKHEVGVCNLDLDGMGIELVVVRGGERAQGG